MLTLQILPHNIHILQVLKDDSDGDGEDDCDDEENNIAGLHIRGPSGDRQHPSPSHVLAPSLESYAKMMMCHDLQS